MREQILAIYIIPILLQIVVPLALVSWMFFNPAKSKSMSLIRMVFVWAYLLASAAAGLWLVVPSSIGVLLQVALAVTTGLQLPGFRTRPWWPARGREWMRFGLLAALSTASVLLLIHVRSGRTPPAGAVVRLQFPLHGGHFYIVSGGSSELLNPHLATLRSGRLRDFRGQSYAVDIVEVRPQGNRVKGFVSRNPEDYFIFGKTVYAPCTGTVIRAHDGFPDMRPPEPDRKHLTGNYVLLGCADYQVLMAHFLNGSVRVNAGDAVEKGNPIARVGNSGNSGEPHLHIHAQRPAKTEHFMSGDPLPIVLGGRYLVRNDHVESRQLDCNP